MFAGQAKAHVVLWQQHAAKALPDIGFVISYPKQFGEREVCQCWVAGELNDPGLPQLRVQPIALRLRSLIAPDERRPQYLIVLIEQNGTVHLAGEAGALDFLRR